MHQKCNLAVCPPGSPNQVTQGDEFLHYWVPRLMAGLGPYDEIIITWDEGISTDTSGCNPVPSICGSGGAQPIINGGSIPTFVVLGSSRTLQTLSQPMDTFSVLAGIENAFSLDGNIPNPSAGEEHFLNQPYATCGCTTPLPL
jgi:hypothetical protein